MLLPRLVAPAIALALCAGPLASVAFGDGGACDVSRGRPTCTILRPSPPATPREAAAAIGRQQCIVIVGGLGSPTDGSDADFFGAVLGDLVDSADHRSIRFGLDAGSYDTTGAISRSAEELRAVISRASDDCEAIHILAHSMGGVVVDRALSKGDPAAAGVATYVAMASPHNGATVARVVRAALDHDPLLAHTASAVADIFGLPDPGSDAIRDLARARAPARIPRVEHLRVRMVTDEVVLRGDNIDRRVDVREYAPAALDELLGHGGIVRSAPVQRIVRETIRSGRVPSQGSGSW